MTCDTKYTSYTFNANEVNYNRTSVILEEIDLDQYFSKKGLGDRGR